MSVNLYYINWDKQQYFSCGILGESSTSWVFSESRGHGGRALAILLSEYGTWQNDRIAVVRDTSPEFEDASQRWLDIEIEVMLMLLEFNGPKWMQERLDESSWAFNPLCAVAFVLQHPGVTKMLDQKYGKGKWHQPYKNSLVGNMDLWSDRVWAVGQRAIRLLVER